MKTKGTRFQTWILCAAALAMGILGGAKAQAQSAVEAWVQRYNPGNGFARANAVAVDASGNVFVTGSAGNFIAPDYATVAYSSAGVPLWTNRYNGPGSYNDQAKAVAVDGSGNVFVTGSSYSVDFIGRQDADYATIAYSNAGVPLWTNRYNGPGDRYDVAHAVAVDASGNVFVTGSSGIIGATIKYSGTGVPLWANYFQGPGYGSAVANAVAVDGNGSVFVTGGSGRSFSSSSYDYLTEAYSSAGLPLWTSRAYNGPGNSDDIANAVAVDASGNVFVTGYSYSGSVSSSSDFATIAYSSAGVPLWTNRYNGPGNNDDIANAVAVDASGNVFVTGSSTGSGGTYDYATIAYSSAGVPLWTNRYNGPGNGSDQVTALAVDGSGNVFVTGTSYSGISNDYATVAYSKGRLPLWTNRYNGPGNGYDIATSVAVDRIGNVFVTGGALGSGGVSDFVTIKYAVSPQPPPKLAIQRATPEGIRICWPTNAANYVLESKDQLSTNVSWTPVITPIGIEGSNFCITNRTDSSNERYYRLRVGN